MDLTGHLMQRLGSAGIRQRGSMRLMAAKIGVFPIEGANAATTAATCAA